MAEPRYPSLSEALRSILGISKDEHFYAVVAGGPGTGKTIFTYQMTWSYLQEGRYVVYASTEDSPQHILEKTRKFGWDMEPYLSSRRLAFLDMYSWRLDNEKNLSTTEYGVRMSPFEIEKEEPIARAKLVEYLKGMPSRILFDCISTPLTDIDSQNYLQAVRLHVARVKEIGSGIATLVKVALPEVLERSALSIFDIIVEAVVEYGPRPKRLFRITKSSLGPHSTDWFTYNITPSGFEIYGNGR